MMYQIIDEKPVDFPFQPTFRSPIIRRYEALLPDFYAQVAAQEKRLIDAGFPAQGVTEFIRSWMYAYIQDVNHKYDTALPEALITDDFVYTWSTFFSREWRWRSRFNLFANWLIYKVAAEVAFLPMNDTLAALPYFDFDGEDIRVTLPWSIPVALRFVHRLPRYAQLGPFRQTIITTGIDRYVLRRVDGKLRLARIDADVDLGQQLIQLLPIRTPVFWKRYRSTWFSREKA